LKQYPRIGFERFGTVIKGLGYIQSQVDHLLFYKHSASDKIAILIVLNVTDLAINVNVQAINQ